MEASLDKCIVRVMILSHKIEMKRPWIVVLCTGVPILELDNLMMRWRGDCVLTQTRVSVEVNMLRHLLRKTNFK